MRAFPTTLLSAAALLSSATVANAAAVGLKLILPVGVSGEA